MFGFFDRTGFVSFGRSLIVANELLKRIEKKETKLSEECDILRAIAYFIRIKILDHMEKFDISFTALISVNFINNGDYIKISKAYTNIIDRLILRTNIWGDFLLPEILEILEKGDFFFTFEKNIGKSKIEQILNFSNVFSILKNNHLKFK